MWSIITPTGDEINLRGLSLAVRAAPGAGMPPLEHITLDPAQEAGLAYQRSLAGGRRLVLRLVSRQRHVTLAATRQALIQALNPDLVRADRPAYLAYEGLTRTLRLPVVYDGGLEECDTTNAIELRLLAYDPAWTATSQMSQTLTVQQALAQANYLLQRRAAGIWATFPSVGGPVAAVLVASDGTLYVGGEFADKLLRWDATSGAWVGLSGLNGDVTSLAEGPDGTIYVGGSFTTPGNFVAAWDGAQWSALGASPAIIPTALAVGNDGALYSGGYDFGAGYTVAKWSGTPATWSAVGAPGPGGDVFALLITASGDLLAGGDFANGVVRWTGASWQPLGAGLAVTGGGSNAVVRALARGLDGLVYAGGTFDRANGVEGVLAPYVAVWTGSAWRALGAGVGTDVLALAVHPEDGTLIAGGRFTVAGGLALPDKMARWNGFAWFPLDVNIISAADPAIVVVATPPDKRLLVGYSAQASAVSAALTTVTNAGSAAAYPIVTITGPGRLYQLANVTAGEALGFDLTLLAGEVLTLDLRPERKTVQSSFRGNLLGALVPGSALATWRLLPGANSISLFLDDARARASLAWFERYWSLDGV